MRNFIVLFYLMLSTLVLATDFGSISGYIMDKTSKEALPKVTVSLVGTDIQTTSGSDGRYELKKIPVGIYTVRATFLGYGSVDVINVPVQKEKVSPLNIFLSPTSLEMEGRIALDYSTAAKKTEDITGKSVIKRPDIKKKERTKTPRALVEKEEESVEDVAGGDSYFLLESAVPKPSPPIPSSSGLRAGFSDDNKQFNYFLNFLNQYKNSTQALPFNIFNRIWITVHDKKNLPVFNEKITVANEETVLFSGKTYPDGSFFFYPSLHSIEGDKLTLKIPAYGLEIPVEVNGKRRIEVKIPGERKTYAQIPADIVFILDTTGSMGEEIERLKQTIEIINLNLSAIKPAPDIRFGMVLYKDRRDEYVVHSIPLTSNLEEFKKGLAEVQAGGGGDEPEDLQTALKYTIQSLDWRSNAVKLGFIITDASIQLYQDQSYTYLKAAMDARKNAIKLFSIGTGGLPLSGEYVLRQIAQLTYAKYIFLHYGEKGESEGGTPGSVSHHTGSNYSTDKLESIIIHFAREEMAYLSDKPIQLPEEYFEASKIDREEGKETLRKLFSRAIGQLIDYSTKAIEKETPAGIIPFQAAATDAKASAEYFTEQAGYVLTKSDVFKAVERINLQKIMEEQGLQLSGLVNEDTAAQVGKILGARMLITGKIFRKDSNYELYLKLVDVETAEILSATKLLIHQELGL